MKKVKIDYKVLLTEIWFYYNSEYKLVLEHCDVPHCHLDEKEIHYPLKRFCDPDNRDVFDMLHEVGHLKTNKKGMKRCEEEFYATEWAIKEMKKYKFELSQKDKQIFQNYIWQWRERGIKLKGKNMPSKEQLTLVW